MRSKALEAHFVGKYVAQCVREAGRFATSALPVAKTDAWDAYCATLGIPSPAREFRFAPLRRWRFDFAWPDHRVALEVEGGVWTQGRHTRGAGFLKDVEKYNAAVLRGWRLIRCTPDTLPGGLDLCATLITRAA